MKEDPGQPHWYDSVFDNEAVQSFVQKHVGEPAIRSANGCNIEGVVTLTVAVPAESDTLCGLRIEKLSIPGRYRHCGVGAMVLTLRTFYRRLGKLRITKSGGGAIKIDSTNVQQFTINRRSGSPGIIDVEGQAIDRDNGEMFVRFSKGAENVWRVR